MGHPLKEISPLSITIAALSTIVEWYDFTLYLYFATVISHVFFGEGSSSLAITLAGFAISYFLRPLGALFFGYIGDHLGRRWMLCLSMALMTATMLITAFLPTYHQVGILAGILLLLLRGAMAFSVGGEYTGVVAYLLEGAHPTRRGLITSLASAASEIGALLAVGISAITVSLLPAAEVHKWGWRIPFFVGATMAAILLLARSALQESPDFDPSHGLGKTLGLSDILRDFPLAVGRTFAISALGSITYYVGVTYIPVFLTSTALLTEQKSLWLSTLAAITIIFVTPVIGAISDQLGRKPLLLALSGACLCLPYPLFLLMMSGNTLLVVCSVVGLACLAGGVSAVGAPATAEQFPTKARLLGLAAGATAATTLFGGLTPYIAQSLIGYTHLKSIPAIMIAAVAACILPILAYLPETAPPKTKF